jgi:hypothetical protein
MSTLCGDCFFGGALGFSFECGSDRAGFGGG